MVKLNLEAVPVVSVGRDGAERGVALGAYACAWLLFAVDDQAAHDVFLILTAVYEALPVVHNDVYGVDGRGIKEPRLISERDTAVPGLEAQRRSTYGKRRYQQRKDQRCDADAVKSFAG